MSNNPESEFPNPVQPYSPEKETKLFELSDYVSLDLESVPVQGAPQVQKFGGDPNPNRTFDVFVREPLGTDSSTRTPRITD